MRITKADEGEERVSAREADDVLLLRLHFIQLDP
jgi:hypothetical protein